MMALATGIYDLTLHFRLSLHRIKIWALAASSHLWPYKFVWSCGHRIMICDLWIYSHNLLSWAAQWQNKFGWATKNQRRTKIYFMTDIECHPMRWKNRDLRVLMLGPLFFLFLVSLNSYHLVTAKVTTGLAKATGSGYLRDRLTPRGLVHPTRTGRRDKLWVLSAQ